jgi:hypothetical protein
MCGRDEKTQKFVVGDSDCNRPLERYRCRRKDNIKTHIKNRMSRRLQDSSGSDRVQCRTVLTKQFSFGFHRLRESLG